MRPTSNIARAAPAFPIENRSMREAPSVHPSPVIAKPRTTPLAAPWSALLLASTGLLAGLLGCTGSVVESDSSTTAGEGGAGGSSSITIPPAQCPAGAWGRGLADSYKYEYGQSVAVDGSCNVVVAGSFGGVMDLGGATITGVDDDVFLAKFDPAGQHLWSRSFGIEPFQGSAVTAASRDGDVVLAGTFGGSIDFGTGAFNAPGQGIFLARFDPAGKPRWARAFTGAGAVVATQVAVDATGAALLTGYFEGFFDLGAGQQGVAGESSAFVARIGPEGQTEWSAAFNGSSPTAASVAVDGEGYSLVTGNFQGKIQVGPVFLGGGKDVSAFVARLDPSGEVVYARSFPANGQSTGNSVTVDAQGNALVAGGFGGTIDLGAGPLAAKSAGDGFLLSLDPTGKTRWGKAFGATSLLQVTQVSADPGGGAWLTGAFGGTLDLETGPLVSDGPTDGLIAAVDANGTFVFAKRFGGASGGADNGYSIAADPAGGAFVTGTFMGTTDLGSGPSESAGGFDAFVARVLK